MQEIFEISTPKQETVQPAGPRRPRIMVVDDHPTFRKCLIRVLREIEELDISCAADGWQAVVLATRFHPDVVIMDVNMPVMNGIEATRTIAEALPGVRVIGLSMDSELETANEMRAAGAIDHFVKDGPVEELLTLIQSQLDLIRQQ